MDDIKLNTAPSKSKNKKGKTSTLDSIIKPDSCFTSIEAQLIMIRAFNGDPEAIGIIFNYIGKYAQPSDMLPEDFLLYCTFKSLQLKSHKDTKVLSQAYPKKAGRQSTHLELVKMVVYLVNTCGIALESAMARVAEEVGQNIESVKSACYQWPPGKRKNNEIPPYQYVQALPWTEKINCEGEYQFARYNVKNKKEILYRCNDILHAAFK